MASREKGYGLTAELQKKKDGKFNVQLAKDAIAWISKVSGEKLPPPSSQGNVQEALRDGVALCKLANAIKPGSVKKIQSSKMAFKMMENIGNFLTACASFGMNQTDLFQTVDLYEGENIPQVVNSIHALGRKAHAINPSVPLLGPKEADKNPRQFTSDQLKSGEGIIGLQMGTNRGANQAGMSFGTGRQIM